MRNVLTRQFDANSESNIRSETIDNYSALRQHIGVLEKNDRIVLRTPRETADQARLDPVSPGLLPEM